ncbi:MAG: glycosyltransferase family 4 protein [bacterium]
MRVYFYTGSFTHTLYREQVYALPESVELVPSSPELRSRGMKSDIASQGSDRSRAMRSAKTMLLRRLVRLGVPNLRYVRAPMVDLIHSAQYPILNRRPWVVDFEDASVFAWYDPVNLRRRRLKQLLQRTFAAPSCRALLPWTRAARASLEHAIDCSVFAHKIRVVYPAIRPRRTTVPAPMRNTLNLLFIGTAFFEKGGLELLEAFRRLDAGDRIRLNVVSRVPEQVRTRYAAVRGVSFHTAIAPLELERLYAEADLLVAPFHTDTFGFVLLEAFAHGIPCIVADHFAAPEIVTHGMTGLVVPNYLSRFDAQGLPAYSLLDDSAQRFRTLLESPPGEYVDRLAAAIDALASDSHRRREMARAALHEVLEGRFSLTARRRAMADVYEAALTS